MNKQKKGAATLEAPAPRQTFGRYYDPILRRWVMLTSDGPIPETPPAVKVTC